MQLKRYSIEELQTLCTDIFYKYMSAVNNDSYDCPTPAHTLHREHQDRLEKYEDRIKMYEKALKANPDTETQESLHKQLKYLTEGSKYIRESNMKNQKELYEATSSTNYARTTIKIPLDKKINSYYDDFTLQVVFYDDVTTLNGKFDEYKELHTEKERRKFIEDNTEITHLGLLWIKNGKLISIIALKGELNTKDEVVIQTNVELLPQEFADLDNLSLKTISALGNNDLKQFFQSKINLDKEQMTELASEVIRGDRYSIHLSPHGSNKESDMYIRYTCRGTGRVYYNLLNLRNLEISPLFEKDNYDSYIKAWWDLNTLGGNPDIDKPVIRC